jgi:pimeloyl-ACP methyl ester carboxylesterase
VHVNVLLPEGYATSSVCYPVLYLFHGTSGGADDWLASGNAAAPTDAYPMIVVMPDAGFNFDGGSWFTNWTDQSTHLGASNWETFHVDQLVPWVDANLRTVATRSSRAVAGLSQGGFGAFSYAARHPDTFAAAGSFSGAPDIASNPVALAGAGTIIEATAFGLDGVEPDAMFGDPVLNNIDWQGHNPATLVTNLAHTTVELWSGDGVPGKLDNPWARTAHAHPQPTPTSISYRSIDKSWTQWGWTVVNARSAGEAFSGLVGASAHGFTVTSPSPATITTPPVYTPGDRYRVTAVHGSAPAVVLASASGQLTVAVTPTGTHASVTVTLVRG